MGLARSARSAWSAWAQASLVGLVAFLGAVPAWAASRIAVQPFAGPGGPELRAQVAGIVRARGLRVVVSLPAVSGTAQYPGWARERGLAAFVVADTEDRPKNNPRRRIVTFLVWHGSNGSVAERWTVSAAPRRLAREVARGFWKRLGRAIESAQAPANTSRLGPAPPMRIDASSAFDDDVAVAPRAP